MNLLERWKASKKLAKEIIDKKEAERKIEEEQTKEFYRVMREYDYHLMKKTGTGGHTVEQAVNDLGDLSDGYHTFNELYNYRMLYNAGFFNELARREGNPFDVHKSIKHHDGEECFGGGWFIVMAQLPTGQISNHYEIQDWNMFNIPSKETANEWDGHSPQEAAERLREFLDLQNYNTKG